ncbi:hypothetical protein BRADI_2g56412v3 [Brachypodium distachyon]|uniref:Uncharacterized protein n=1 Tax=Brachypodium distachyon TaxID=15368 RepID=A0A2K2DG86_BRADI|nr:hypothetical protein BRADI_2g56412v3 [Brachypodium distachyon]PNT73279.1 hypothetical protein BRADI_2g56412v3 [Brachypodium distachyon]PNT73280.1 hypothetical protein BRADI_2g56412v3 [Brachypodium distachyon]
MWSSDMARCNVAALYRVSMWLRHVKLPTHISCLLHMTPSLHLRPWTWRCRHMETACSLSLSDFSLCTVDHGYNMLGSN